MSAHSSMTKLPRKKRASPHEPLEGIACQGIGCDGQRGREGRCGRRVVPHRVLDEPEIDVGLQQRGRRAVTEGVDQGVLLDTTALAGGPEGLLDTVSGPSTTLLVLTCMRYPWIKKEDTHGYTRQSSLVARVGRVFGHLPGALPSPGGRGRLGALPDRVAHRIAQQELRHYGGGRPRDQ